MLERDIYNFRQLGFLNSQNLHSRYYNSRIQLIFIFQLFSKEIKYRNLQNVLIALKIIDKCIWMSFTVTAKG